MLYQRFSDAAGQAPATSGLHEAGRFVSYADVAERAGRIATGLLARGIERGTPIGLLMINGPELLTLAYGIFGAGAVVVPLNAHAPRAELAMTARKAHVGAVIASQPYADVAASLVADLAGPGALPLFIAGSTDDWSVAALERYSTGTLPQIGPNDHALYMFSSGSTGIPKVVPHTHAELDIDLQGAREVGRYNTSDIMINMMPGSHAMGFLSAIHVAAACASTLYWSDPQPFMLSRGRFAKAIQDNGVTVVMGVPFMFDALAGLRDEVDLSSVRYAQSGGVALRRETYDRFKARFGIPLRQGYGSTECLSIAINDFGDPDATWDSVGKPAPRLTLTLEPADNPFGPEVGEIVVSSPAVTKGYLDAPEVNARTLRDGKFYTGDLGALDSEGNVYIKGRSKLIIEVAGHKVDPFEIEEVLGTHPAVAEAVVVGIPDARTGEQRLKAVVVRAADETPDALIRFCRERLASQKVPAVVEFRDEIPKSATGKILRGKLMEAANA
ncbi:MAG TPA: class I adenylate-forming enzyme family protein [Devosia sp.]|nr:class I adenylate-forming enzyme family protein [Devosia sp.]